MATPHVFVSHSHLDEEFTKSFVADLKRAGADVWVDIANIRDGDFMQRINDALAQCEWLVLVETNNSLESDAVKMEVNAAIELVRRKRMTGVIPFVTSPLTVNVPPLWTTLHYYDASAQGYDRAFRGLEQALGLWVEPAPPITPWPEPAPQIPHTNPIPTPATTYPPSPVYPTPTSTGSTRTRSGGFTILKFAGRIFGTIAGIIGALVNFVLNAAHSTVARVVDFTSQATHGWWGTILCLVGLLGALIALPFPGIAAMLMLIAGVGMVFIIPWYLAVVGSSLLLIGALLTFLDRRSKTS